MTNWIYKGKEFLDEDIGKYKAFVYIIINKTSGKYYIGRKNFHAPKYTTIKGKKKRKMVISNYQNYWGSSENLLKAIEEDGKDAFSREILYLCTSKGESNYIEAKEQFDRGVLLDDNSFNRIINCRIHASHVRKLRNKNEGIDEN